MNQTLSAAVQAPTPPILWNAMQRLRRLPVRHPWREFGQMSTCADPAPLLTGTFADLYNVSWTAGEHARRLASQRGSADTRLDCR